MAQTCRKHSLPMASHDDASPEARQHFHDLGCRVCEFPVNRATAELAMALNDPVILGAPNALRGESHDSRLTAREAISAGLCTVLSSDYYYPTLLQAPFALAREEIMPLGLAWNLVSKNAAEAVGLSDRGAIKPGLRADLVIIDDTNATLPRTIGCLCAGRLAYVGGELAQRMTGLSFADRPVHPNATSGTHVRHMTASKGQGKRRRLSIDQQGGPPCNP
jgi:alpha-D-ribose 1-methylphosphonate 5-triphosphate diphosphatase